MCTEIVHTVYSVSMGDIPTTNFLQIRVDSAIYFVYEFYRWRPDPIDQVIFLGYQREGMDTLFTHIPYEDDTFAWAARQLREEPATGTRTVRADRRRASRG